ncbi:MAG: FAD:protein FMN transferase [Pirellulales bacterium]|nr:FAD:protein FMN transferase [Pirellulales bacterium]
MTRKSSRRDFLRGKSAARAMADAARAALPEDTQSPPPHGRSLQDEDEKGYLLQICRQAMACEFEVCLNAGQYSHGMDAALKALDMIDSLEALLSIFRDDSQISEINQFASDGPVMVDKQVFELLELCARLNRQTDGALDISAGSLSDAWGFSRRAGSIPTDADLAEAMRRVGMKNVVLDAEDQSVHFLRSGMRLNLGAIGKGYALDRAAEVLQAAGIQDFMIHGGQSSVLALGSSTENQAAMKTSEEETESLIAGWTVGVAHPLRSGHRLAEIRLKNRALATSGSFRQFFRYQGRRYSHILDPRNGQPAQGVLSATVLAPTAAEADALSTAVFVLGHDRSRELLETRMDVGVMMALPLGGGSRVEIVTFGIPEQDFRII